MSKKLATIITAVPCLFHDEDFRIKEFNKEMLKDIFTELEFKALGRRILGEDFNMFSGAPESVQTDLFGNVVSQKRIF